jgi:hypothetical protein
MEICTLSGVDTDQGPMYPAALLQYTQCLDPDGGPKRISYCLAVTNKKIIGADGRQNSILPHSAIKDQTKNFLLFCCVGIFNHKPLASSAWQYGRIDILLFW